MKGGIMVLFLFLASSVILNYRQFQYSNLERESKTSLKSEFRNFSDRRNIELDKDFTRIDLSNFEPINGAKITDIEKNQISLVIWIPPSTCNLCFSPSFKILSNYLKNSLRNSIFLCDKADVQQVLAYIHDNSINNYSILMGTSTISSNPNFMFNPVLLLVNNSEGKNMVMKTHIMEKSNIELTETFIKSLDRYFAAQPKR